MSKDAITTILGDFAVEIINYDKRMNDAGAPSVRFISKYIKKYEKRLKTLRALTESEHEELNEYRRLNLQAIATNPSQQPSEVEATKYPNKDGTGSIYGTPEISSILAGFESGIGRLSDARSNYAPNSKSLEKRYDDVRLEAATRIMQHLATEVEKVLDKIESNIAEHRDSFPMWDGRDERLYSRFLEAIHQERNKLKK